MMHGMLVARVATFLFLVSALACGPAAAFRSTKVEGHTDPDFVGYQPKTLMLEVVGADTEMRQQINERMVKEMSAFGVRVIPERDLFPPTRQWTPEQRFEILNRQGIEGGIIIAIGASSAQVVPIARQSYGTANTTGAVHGNGAFSANTTAQSASYNVLSAKSSAEFSAVLVDIKTGKVAWTGDILSKASGTLFVGSKGDAKASVKGVIDGLEEDGHIAKQGR